MRLYSIHLISSDFVFQSTHPSGVRLVFGASARTSVIFQSTHPSGVRPNMLRLGNAVRVFQSTHPSGVRQWNCKTIYKTRDFNPRTPVGCDGYFIALSQAGQVFQSTHPSGVRPFVHGGRQPTPTISIHAPQWGATDGGLAIANPIPISIHAPQWGATSPYSRTANSPTDFNPRTPVGCDRRISSLIISPSGFQSTHPSGVRRHAVSGVFQLFVISIHAPQWGATPPSPKEIMRDSFQSTHPSGVRQ